MIAEICTTNGVEEEAAYWAGMALREALANAIKHGNKLNPDKRVFVHVSLHPDGELHIEVEDEGDGFDPAVLADPTMPDNIMRSSGRGVYYMRQFMDKVQFRAGERGGTCLELVKHISSGRTT